MKRFSILLLLFLTACGSQVNTSKVSKEEQQEKTQEIIKGNSFRIEMDRAFPQNSSSFTQVFQKLNLSAGGNSVSSINISGNSDYIQIKEDTVSGNLPFFGERYSGSNLNPNERGINFEGIPRSFKSHTEQGITKISFGINAKSHRVENYKVGIKIYDNGKADIVITSTQRSSMEYRGRVKELDGSAKN